MKILVISRTAWRKDNSFGNTYSNIFDGMADVKIANLYFGDGLPDGSAQNVIDYYRVSEKDIVKKILKKDNDNNGAGERVHSEVFPTISEGKHTKGIYENIIRIIKKNRCSLFYIVRELIWRFSSIDYSGILRFIDEFKPDIIFASFYYAIYTNRMIIFIKENRDIPLVLEAAVDIYTLKQFSVDPFYWGNRLWVRAAVKKTAALADRLYVISKNMKNDYKKELGVPTEVLYKFPDINRERYLYKADTEKEIVFLFTGNISSNRWKSLSTVGKIVAESGIGKLYIYTKTILTHRMRRALSYCELKEPISAEEVINKQNAADVLVHVESFDIKNKLEVRYSISTKIMDYISVGRCILAYGPAGIASMDFLKEEEVALVCNTKRELELTINRFRNNTDLISRCALKNHNYINELPQKSVLQNYLLNDLKRVISKSEYR